MEFLRGVVDDDDAAHCVVMEARGPLLLLGTTKASDVVVLKAHKVATKVTEVILFEVIEVGYDMIDVSIREDGIVFS